MSFRLDQLWPWMLQTFGVLGTMGVLFVILVLGCSWVLTPIGLWRLYRKGRVLEQQVAEVEERTAALSRQQQVQRLRRDKGRRRSPRRR